MADGLSLDVGLELDDGSISSFKSKLTGALGSVGSALKSGISAVGSVVISPKRLIILCKALPRFSKYVAKRSLISPSCSFLQVQTILSLF